MAITRDNYAYFSPSSGWSTLSENYTNNGDVLIVFIAHAYGDATPSVTYGGQAMTHFTYVNYGPSAVFSTVDAYYLLSPPTGSNTIVANESSGNGYGIFVWSGKGALLTSFPDAVNTAAVNADTVSVTTVANDAAVMGFGITSYPFTASSGTSLIGSSFYTSEGNYANILEHSPLTQPTSASVTLSGSTTGAAQYDVFIAVSIAPAPVNIQISISDTTAVSDTTHIQYPPQNVSVSDTFVVSDTPTIGVRTIEYDDLQCTIQTSSYKWMSTDLDTAQQAYSVQPYFKAKIIDDRIVPSQAITGITEPRYNTSFTDAPDGSIVGAGIDFANNNVVFYKTNDLHAGSFGTQVVLRSATSDILDTQNSFCIKVSDWINGSYHVDVWFLSNFGTSGTDLISNHYYSDDGGATFNSETFTISNLPNTNYPSLAIPFAALTPRYNPTLKTAQGGFIYGYPAQHSSSNITYGSAAYQAYTLHYYWGDPVNGYQNVDWNANSAGSIDWTIHSIDTYYMNKVDHVVLSGFRNFLEAPNENQVNNSIYDIPIFNISGTSNDVWGSPNTVFSTQSVSANNHNSCTYPAAHVYTKYLNGNPTPMVNVTFKLVEVSSLSTATGTLPPVTTTTDYVLVQSVDGTNFTYPETLTLGNTQFGNNSGEVEFRADYIPQGVYFYAVGSSTTVNLTVWEYTNNNIVADITDDVITYSINENAGQPSSISIQIANQNNQWIGNSPTKAGAAAIASNNKIVVQQGYYTADGTPQAVPHTVYNIDDINQNTSAKDNSATIAGRDFYKGLGLQMAKYAYNIFNSFSYEDTFNGSTIANWNQQSGSWTESGKHLLAPNTTTDSVITVANMTPNSAASTTVVWFRGQTSGEVHVYPMYFDADNWVRFELQFHPTSGIPLAQLRISDPDGNTNTQLGDTSSYVNCTDTTKWYPLIIKQFNYTEFGVLIGAGYSSPGDIAGFSTNLHMIGNATFNLNTYNEWALWGGTSGSTYSPPTNTQWSVGLGSNGIANQFANFQYAEYAPSLNFEELIKRIATRARIFVYKFQNVFKEYFFGTYTYDTSNASITQRQLVIQPGGSAYNNDESLDDGELRCIASVIPSDGTLGRGFTFAFRVDSASGPTALYKFHIRQEERNYTHVYLERLYSGGTYTIAPSFYTILSPYSTNGSLNLDLARQHEYRAVFINQWMYLYIDGVQVAAWNDDNTTSDALTTGYWGFEADANSTVYISEVTSTSFWKQNPSLSINPGDDALSILTQYTQNVYAWFFSDLFGRFKAKFLSSSDPSTYTYSEHLYQSGADASSKEYIARVTVYGKDVSATARNNSLMQGQPTRDMVIVDYTITTQKDAQQAANNALINQNQYINQLNPKQKMNVGAELFDAVTIVDTGSNTLQQNTETRVYAQKFTTGGSANEFSIELDTGQL